MPLLHVDQIHKLHPTVHQSPTAKQIQHFSLSKQMEHLDHRIQDLKKQYYQSDFYKQFAQYRDTLRIQLFKPLSSAYTHTYSELPQETSKRKWWVLEKFSYDQRLMFLNGLSLGSAVLSMRGINQYNGWMMGMKSLRNTGVTYLLAGLLIAPEIFNPLLRGWENVRIE